MNDPIQVRVDVLGKKISIAVKPDDELFIRGVLEYLNDVYVETRDSRNPQDHETTVALTILLIGEEILFLRNEKDALEKENETMKKQLQELQMRNNAFVVTPPVVIQPPEKE